MSTKKTTKKTAAKRAAKKPASKAAKAFEALLGLKPAMSPEGRAQFEKDKLAHEVGETAAETILAELEPDEWRQYGPLGGKEDPELEMQILGIAPATVSDAPVTAQEASEPTPGHIVPESTPNAPQYDPVAFYKELDQKIAEIHELNQDLKKVVDKKLSPPVTLDPPTFTRAEVAACIENLIDACNHLYSLNSRKVLGKDVPTLQKRVAKGRLLIQKLRQ